MPFSAGTKIIPLRGKIPALREVHAELSGQQQFYSVKLTFDNGQSFSFPSYIPKIRATKSAIALGETVAEKTLSDPEFQLDIPTLIKEEILPLKDFLRTRFQEFPAKDAIPLFVGAVINGQKDECLYISRGSKTLWIPVPGIHSNPDLAEFCKDMVVQLAKELQLGEVRRERRKGTRKATKETPRVISSSPEISAFPQPSIPDLEIHKVGTMYSVIFQSDEKKLFFSDRISIPRKNLTEFAGQLNVFFKDVSIEDLNQKRFSGIVHGALEQAIRQSFASR